jgi:hypothetical protein
MRFIRLFVTGLIAVAVVGALASSSFAAKPRAGLCWGGSCNPLASTVKAGFEVEDNAVQGLLIPERCLGHYGPHHQADYLFGLPGLEISSTGTFLLAERFPASLERGGQTTGSVYVENLHGRFLSPTKAVVSLKIDHAGCGTKHVTILGHHHHH